MLAVKAKSRDRGCSLPCIRKTANLLFLLEQAGKAGKSGGKHQMHSIAKQGPFSKSIAPPILCGMLFLLGQADESSKKHR